MRKMSKVAFAVLVMMGASASFADVAVYVGTGSGRDGGKNPAVIGALGMSKDHGFLVGMDIAKEGIRYDTTWGVRSKDQSTSFNLLLGANVYRGENSRVDISAILGLREASSDCPRSYLGYQCYADQDPEMRHKFNGGALVTWNYKNLLLGARITGESTQAVVGVKF